LLAIYLVVGGFAVVCTLPFWLILSASLTGEKTLLEQGFGLWPRDLTTYAYQWVFTSKNVLRAYSVSVLITVVGTLLALAVTAGYAYVLSRHPNLRYRGVLTVIAVIPMLFSGGLVPWYLVMTRVLNLDDTVWALILPLCFSPYLTIILRTFFNALPGEIVDSAIIDGAGQLTILTRIMLPLSTPALATLALFYGLAYWNDWWNALMLINYRLDLRPLQFMLRGIINSARVAAETSDPRLLQSAELVPSIGIRMASVVVTVGPIVFLYPWLQQYFIKGLTVGALKE
jgi:ABC-type glycerol-3-phosphate transport system permease component